jgi:hypothetical protein
MANAWITKVKQYQADHPGTSYKDSLIACGCGCPKKPKKAKKTQEGKGMAEFLEKYRVAGNGKKPKKQKGGLLPLAVAVPGLLASGALTGTTAFAVNKLLGEIF